MSGLHWVWLTLVAVVRTEGSSTARDGSTKRCAGHRRVTGSLPVGRSRRPSMASTEPVVATPQDPRMAVWETRTVCPTAQGAVKADGETYRSAMASTSLDGEDWTVGADQDVLSHASWNQLADGGPSADPEHDEIDRFFPGQSQEAIRRALWTPKQECVTLELGTAELVRDGLELRSRASDIVR